MKVTLMCLLGDGNDVDVSFWWWKWRGCALCCEGDVGYTLVVEKMTQMYFCNVEREVGSVFHGDENEARCFFYGEGDIDVIFIVVKWVGWGFCDEDDGDAFSVNKSEVDGAFCGEDYIDCIFYGVKVIGVVLS